MSTIFALSSGQPPAAIGVVRLSGSQAFGAAQALVDHLPPPRRAGLRTLRHPETGEVIDRALVLVFPGPATATGEDLVEFHCHGGRAVIAALEEALIAFPGLRRAEPGEFTRRALASGRIDLAEAEGLGDLLNAETELQRQAAMQATEGRVSQAAEQWTRALLSLSAGVEAMLDHDDEEDVARTVDPVEAIRHGCADLALAMKHVLANPPVERLHDGFCVVLAGPPNAGKSTLLNALAERELAIVSPIAGTTRDRIEATVKRGGIVYRLIDTAGLADATDDMIEAIGIDRARQAVAGADLMLWLGDEPPQDAPARWLWLHPRADLTDRAVVVPGRIGVSAATGMGLDRLWSVIEEEAAQVMPRLDRLVLNQRQRALSSEAAQALSQASSAEDTLIMAEALRIARRAVDAITGRAGTEEMLDALFSRFCIGK